ncbi:VOC family protein [Nocardioides sp. cx-169]|uniref:VOC family protein n=1 Tax=Nocardioides sp. cx-169 TaxID=2899080 RepID=UPI001E51DF9E|nr:VOC family protein [Nocardioides sp. cx-169]MCD4534875.1 VOC family protein [Nocardioides sp. cx-169]
MSTYRVTLSVPTEDRPRAHAFFTALGFATPGEPADDGVPEPLQVAVNDGMHVMLIPTGGFGWVTGGRTTAPRGTVECLVSLAVDSQAAVDALLTDVAAAGGEVVSTAAQQPWGYTGTFADPDGHLWEITAPPA